jgi:hypothetical protein
MKVLTSSSYYAHSLTLMHSSKVPAFLSDPSYATLRCSANYYQYHSSSFECCETLSYDLVSIETFIFKIII